MMLKLRQREVMFRTIADYARASLRRTAAIDACRLVQVLRCLGANTGKIVVEDEGTAIVLITRTTHPRVPWTQIAIRDVFRRNGLLMLKHFAAPGTILPV